MSKSVMARRLLGGVVAFAVGLALGQASIAFGQAAGVYVTDGDAIFDLRVAPVGLIVVGIASASAVTLLAGALTVVVLWAAALANARTAARTGWFWLVLILGVLTLGVGALVTYLIAGPDRAASTA